VAVRTLGHTGAARPRERRRTRKFTHEDEINVVVKLGFIGRTMARHTMRSGATDRSFYVGMEARIPGESGGNKAAKVLSESRAIGTGNRLQFKHQVRIIE